jgi:pimeloyl-ACP methyl ester carboxylesterase
MIHSRPEMVHTHQTARTQFVEANGIRFAYRRFGKSGGVPLVFNQHFTGTMDHWDPAVTDGFAKDREVILFNNAGVSSSSGEVPTSIAGMAANASIPTQITARSTSTPNCSSVTSRCSCRRTSAEACEDRKRSRYPPRQQRGR